MILVITADLVELVDADVFTALSVRSALGDAALREAIAAHDLGAIDPGGAHVWLDPAVLLCMASGGGAARLAGTAGMIEFAAARGWVDAAGRIRAHIERQDEPESDAERSARRS